GITSAYLPLSATAVRKDLFEAFKGTEEYDHFRHVNTFGGNPAACAVALKNLEILEREHLVGRAGQLGKKLDTKLSDMSSHPNIGDVRSKGLLMGVQLVEYKNTKKPSSQDRIN